MKKNNIIKGIFFAGTLFLGVSCTQLNEEILDGVIVSEGGSGGTVNPVAFLTNVFKTNSWFLALSKSDFNNSLYSSRKKPLSVKQARLTN